MTDFEQTQSKPLLAAGLAGEEYGLVSLPPRAKKLRCVFPHKESKVCSHVQTFERNEGTIKESETISIGKNKASFFDDIPDLDIDGEVKSHTKILNETKPEKIQLPLNELKMAETRLITMRSKPDYVEFVLL